LKSFLWVFALSLFISVTQATENSQWSYSGATGPDNWATLSSKFSDCSGRNQSPVDLNSFIEAELKPIKFVYNAGNQVINNGHTIQVNSGGGGYIELDNQKFRLLQFHFHAPSENHIKGKSFPMEAHLVHGDDQGNLAVVAVMFEEGSENPILQQVWQVMPKQAGGKKNLSSPLHPYKLLPTQRSYYRFNGSLTTPPCTEGVHWIVMKRAVSASVEQIRMFEEVMHHPNNRPIQALNSRMILR
jgi:carbonic anhydrase